MVNFKNKYAMVIFSIPKRKKYQETWKKNFIQRYNSIRLSLWRHQFNVPEFLYWKYYFLYISLQLKMFLMTVDHIFIEA
jgi:hypothetical protein